MAEEELNNFTPEFKDFVLKMFHNIQQTDIEYIYRGKITPETVASTLDLAKYNLEKTVEVIPIRHRVYFIMGEGLQNITKHQDPADEDKLIENSLIIISKNSGIYRITTANLIRNQNIDDLKEKLNRINELTLSELRQLARDIRKNTVLDDNSNANIGLVEIAKRSGSELLYKFNKINDEFSYFYLSILISIDTLTKRESLLRQDNQYLDHILDFHEFLNKINSKLIFKGDFSQENIVALLEMLKHQIPESTTSIKVNNIMIEMLQNIEKHGDNLHNIKDWKPGFFMINFLNEKFYLTSANYILNSKIDHLKHKLVSLNNMTKEELSKIYRKILLEMDSITAQKTGLGFIDMRRRSNNKFKFTFLPVDDKISLFIFQIIVNS